MIVRPLIRRSPTGRFVRDIRRWQYGYSDRALRSGHISNACGCLACADMRVATGHRPLDPNPELSRLARLALARDAALTEAEVADLTLLGQALCAISGAVFVILVFAVAARVAGP